MGKYVLALDPARGGVGRDEYIACIVHFDHATLIVDKFHAFAADFEINGKKEVSIQAVEDWIREHHKTYQFDSIVLDQFNSSATIQSLSGDFPIRELTWSVSTKMKAFSKMKELFNAGLVDIYPHEQAIRQLKNLNVVYEKRKEYENSVTLLNDKLAKFLDDKQKQAQEMFPHYFERYKTDGVEYNIYIGQSITNNKNF